MYTSEIRETDHEGKPVAVSPALLARVHNTDEVLRSAWRQMPASSMSGGWVFPEPERGSSVPHTVRVPNEPEPFTVFSPVSIRRRASSGFRTKRFNPF